MTSTCGGRSRTAERPLRPAGLRFRLRPRGPGEGRCPRVVVVETWPQPSAGMNGQVDLEVIGGPAAGIRTVGHLIRRGIARIPLATCRARATRKSSSASWARLMGTEPCWRTDCRASTTVPNGGSCPVMRFKSGVGKRRLVPSRPAGTPATAAADRDQARRAVRVDVAPPAGAAEEQQVMEFPQSGCRIDVRFTLAALAAPLSAPRTSGVVGSPVRRRPAGGAIDVLRPGSLPGRNPQLIDRARLRQRRHERRAGRGRELHLDRDWSVIRAASGADAAEQGEAG